ncbi:hypothetical protein ACJDU8_24135 [Clostridium sp. WILCCON 0269]|uniref:Uncharacterized protein n=1 Tax=Candidatus Clostridium eludens TaxID=3381663 RepID=A0ABW8SRL3_9CLOT
MKNEYLIMKVMSDICLIATIILAICFFIVHIESKKLLPIVFINLLICQILNYMQNRTSSEYTKYDGIKIFLSCVLFLGIAAIVIL